jgi:hypothetical protein
MGVERGNATGCGVRTAGLALSLCRDGRGSSAWIAPWDGARAAKAIGVLPPPIGVLPIATPSGFPDSRQRARVWILEVVKRNAVLRVIEGCGRIPGTLYPTAAVPRRTLGRGRRDGGASAVAPRALGAPARRLKATAISIGTDGA